MRNIIRRLFAQHRGFLIPCALVLAAFQFLLCAIVGSIDAAGAFAQLTAFAPPALRSVIEQSLMGGSPSGMLSFGWNHPVTHALLTAVAITFGARAVAGEIENGAIELILAQPISRARYLGAHVLFAIASLILVLSMGMLGTVIGQRVFDLPLFQWVSLGALMLNAMLLMLAIFSLTLLISCFGRESGRVGGLAVLLTLISYVIGVVSNLWSKAAFLRPYSLHDYYEPRDILAHDHLATSSVVLLALVSFLALAAAFTRFRTRDLP
jgi:ABC-2 type transport system permease protein